MVNANSFVVLLTAGFADESNPESAVLAKHLENEDTRKRHASLGPVERGLLSLSYFAPAVSKEVGTFKLENFLDGDKFTPVARFQDLATKWYAERPNVVQQAGVTYIGFPGVASLVKDLAAASAAWGNLPWGVGEGARIVELDYDSCEWTLTNMSQTTLRKVSKDAQSIQEELQSVKEGKRGSRAQMVCLVCLAYWRGIV